MRELLPSLKLIRGSVLRTLLLGFLLSCVASLAAIGLLGLSGWFITMSALVGIAGSTSFSYLFPSGGVRAFALLRALGRYGERTVNHQATFLFLARLRVAFFDGALRLPMRALSSLRSGDLLNRVMADIDTLDQVLLRVLVPTASALIVVTGTLVFLVFQCGGAHPLRRSAAGTGGNCLVPRRGESEAAGSALPGCSRPGAARPATVERPRSRPDNGSRLYDHAGSAPARSLVRGSGENERACRRHDLSDHSRPVREYRGSAPRLSIPGMES